MKGVIQHSILTNAYSRSHLIDQGKKNGIHWEEDRNDGINWLRFSIALVKYLDSGNEFHTDDADEETLNTMLQSYSQIRELQKKLMMPHLRAAMSKLASEKGADVAPMDMLEDAYKLLDQSGGKAWADKVQCLVSINQAIANLNTRLGKGTEGSTDATPL